MEDYLLLFISILRQRKSRIICHMYFLNTCQKTDIYIVEKHHKYFFNTTKIANIFCAYKQKNLKNSISPFIPEIPFLSAFSANSPLFAKILIYLH